MTSFLLIIFLGDAAHLHRRQRLKNGLRNFSKKVFFNCLFIYFQ